MLNLELAYQHDATAEILKAALEVDSIEVDFVSQFHADGLVAEEERKHFVSDLFTGSGYGRYGETCASISRHVISDIRGGVFKFSKQKLVDRVPQLKRQLSDEVAWV